MKRVPKAMEISHKARAVAEWNPRGLQVRPKHSRGFVPVYRDREGLRHGHLWGQEGPQGFGQGRPQGKGILPAPLAVGGLHGHCAGLGIQVE
jgi:hypothetical protein